MEEQNNGQKKDRTKQNANLKPFPKKELMTEADRERQRIICAKGGQANKERLAKKKSMNELAKSLLDSSITKEQAKRIIGEDINLISDDEELTVAQVLNVVMTQESIKGNVRAYEALRDTAGYSPKKEIELSADIMTDADRQLLAKISGRIG